MSAIKVVDASYAHPGGETLFFDVSFQVSPGEHVALIGNNGVGKTTLLQMIAGLLHASSGEVVASGGTLYMPQDIGYRNEGTVREMLLDHAEPRLRAVGREIVAAERGLARCQTNAGIRLGAALADWGDLGGYELEATWDAAARRAVGAGIDDIGARDSTELSGGERKRLVLDVLFSSAAPILLLDEPDNYLDIPGKRWLEARISESTKTVLLISHDRELLRNATTKIVTMESTGVWVHGGSYRTYTDARGHRQQLLADALRQWKDEERRLYRHYKTMKQRARLNDNNAPAANAAETRWKKFVAAGPPPPPVPDQQVRVRLIGGNSARRVIQAQALGIEGLIKPTSFEVRFGDRVGLIGPNGSGKTHLIKLLAGAPLPHTGSLRLGNRVTPGVFTQVNDHPELEDRTVLDIVAERLGNHEQSMRSLASYVLQGAAARPYSTLSGGQKARLEILCLELDGHNLLLMDEPTDNLDIDSSEALETALAGFEGTVVAVSHDRAFLRTLDSYIMLLLSGMSYFLPDYASASIALESPEDTPGIKLAKPLVDLGDMHMITRRSRG